MCILLGNSPKLHFFWQKICLYFPWMSRPIYCPLIRKFGLCRPMDWNVYWGHKSCPEHLFPCFSPPYVGNISRKCVSCDDILVVFPTEEYFGRRSFCLKTLLWAGEARLLLTWPVSFMGVVCRKASRNMFHVRLLTLHPPSPRWWEMWHDKSWNQTNWKTTMYPRESWKIHEDEDKSGVNCPLVAVVFIVYIQNHSHGNNRKYNSHHSETGNWSGPIKSVELVILWFSWAHWPTCWILAWRPTTQIGSSFAIDWWALAGLCCYWLRFL